MKARNNFINNSNTMKILSDQYEKLKLKSEYLYGKLELVTDDIVDKYDLGNKKCKIEEDGTITEKT